MAYVKITSENCPQKLIDFLKKEGAFEAFEKNCNDEKCDGTFFANPNNIIVSPSSEFRWIKTKEGVRYWGKLDNKYNRL